MNIYYFYTIYVLGIFISLFLIYKRNKIIELRCDKIPLDVAILFSVFSFVTVFIFILNIIINKILSENFKSILSQKFKILSDKFIN